MQGYINSVKYIPVPKYQRVIIDSEYPSYFDSTLDFSQSKIFKKLLNLNIIF